MRHDQSWAPFVSFDRFLFILPYKGSFFECFTFSLLFVSSRFFLFHPACSLPSCSYLSLISSCAALVILHFFFSVYVAIWFNCLQLIPDTLCDVPIFQQFLHLQVFSFYFSLNYALYNNPNFKQKQSDPKGKETAHLFVSYNLYFLFSSLFD